MSLETMLRGVAEPTRILDLVENFIVFQEKEHGLITLAAKNHQYLGVNNTIARLDGMTEGESQLDRTLPDAYTRALFTAKCDAIYQHLFESYFGSSVYSKAA